MPGTRKILSSYVMAPVSFYEISREQLAGTRKVLRTLIHGTRGLKFLMTPRLVYCHAIWLWLLGKNQSWKDKEHLGMFEHHILAINRSSLFKQKCALIYSAIALLLNLASGKKNLFSTISFYIFLLPSLSVTPTHCTQRCVIIRFRLVFWFQFSNEISLKIVGKFNYWIYLISQS